MSIMQLFKVNRMAYTIMLLSVVVTAHAQPQLNTQKEKDIYLLLELTKVKANVDDMVEKAIAYVQQQKPQVNQEVWQKVRKAVKFDQYLLQLVPIYDKHYTHEEIKALNRFFGSDAGKKYINKARTIGQESYTVGKDFGKEIGLVIQQKLKESGY